METPDQQAERAITDAMDQAIGWRTQEVDQRVRAKIWQILRDEHINMLRMAADEEIIDG